VYSIDTIGNILRGSFLTEAASTPISHLVYDSRAIPFPPSSLFFALRTAHQDGHKYIPDAYHKGVRCFVVDHAIPFNELPDATILHVPDTLRALQQLARYHREQFSIPVIGITGSNGKTVVKEWLYQLLHEDHSIVRSPKSFNSQIGVPLSVWQVDTQHTLGIFEAGISQPGEMEHLASVIQPTIGILTNLGEAHDEGFLSPGHKLQEKLKLFDTASLVIGPEDLLKEALPGKEHFTWGLSASATLRILRAVKSGSGTTITAYYKGIEQEITIPFRDEASVQNAITCWCVLLHLGLDAGTIKERFLALHPVDMRLQLVKGINNCTLINDSYSADLTSLHIALAFTAQQQTAQLHTVILSDFAESGKKDEELYQQIAQGLVHHHVEKVIAIGTSISTYLPRYLPPGVRVRTYPTTEDFIKHFTTSAFQNETVLVKGARRFQFEQVVQLLQTKVHQTFLEINLNAVAHNLKQYQKLLKPGTRVMAMVKAFAYGSGGAEIASILQYNNTAYLGVAYVDEGIELRRGGITLPIMVMNADEHAFPSLIEHNLQPVIYSMHLLRLFEQYLDDQGLSNYPVHIELETGMNRLGFAAEDVPALGTHLKASPYIKVESVFSHLAASEDPAHDPYTAQQAAIFQQSVSMLGNVLPYPFLKHIANSAAIIRHPHLQFDMVRLGIGLYGVEIATEKLDLLPVATLRATIAQLKHLHAGDTVSYNRRGIVKEDSLIATVRIGYADGYSRRLGNAVGRMWVNGHLAPVIGTVCMDMTMIDVTGIPGVREGDEVIVFGGPLPVEQVAEWAGTIPYEIMTGVSARVKRVYFQE
jgi:alanine racemase